MRKIIYVMIAIFCHATYAATDNYDVQPNEQGSVNIPSNAAGDHLNAPVNNYGTAAGSVAPSYGIGDSAVIIPTVVVAVTGVMLLSLGGGSGGNGSNTSTTTTTTTTTVPR